MAEEEKKDSAELEDEATPKKSLKDQIMKKLPIILIAGGVAILLVVVAVSAFFVATKMMSNNTGGNAPHTTSGAVQTHEPGLFVKLGEGEGIIVNVGGIKGGHFLKVGLVLELNPNNKMIVTEGKLTTMAETKILDTVLHILRSEQIDNFDAAKQDELKKKIQDTLNDILGGGSVYEVYITSFVLQ